MSPIFVRHRVNTIAEVASLGAEWGAEIDLRSDVRSGSLHLSHDPFKPGDGFEPWLEAYRKRGCSGALIVNTKEDGLETSAAELLNRFQIKNYFFLDTTIPTLVRWTLRGKRALPFAFPSMSRLRASWLSPDAPSGHGSTALAPSRFLSANSNLSRESSASASFHRSFREAVSPTSRSFTIPQNGWMPSARKIPPPGRAFSRPILQKLAYLAEPISEILCNQLVLFRDDDQLDGDQKNRDLQEQFVSQPFEKDRDHEEHDRDHDDGRQAYFHEPFRFFHKKSSVEP